MNQTEFIRKWPSSQLHTAINCLTYGIHCLYFDRFHNLLRPCLFSMHEEYINIVHVIIEGRASLLFELQNVQSMSNKDIFVRQSLKSKSFDHFLVVYMSNLESHVLVMHSENQLNVLWEGLEYFIDEGKYFYERIAENDPFKAETTMLFMNADVDGSKLLDLKEVQQIFNKLKIWKPKEQIKQAIFQINKDLYEKENLKKPKDFSFDKLTPLGFQYILQFYSMKGSLAPVYTELCPIFKFKHKQFKKSIIDILKSQTKPLMSAIQFQEFLKKYIKLTMREDECLQLIKMFPIYDGEGKQIAEEVEYLSFHSFCNFVFSPKNSLFDPEKTETYQDIKEPITEYFVYSSSMPEYNEKAYNESILKYYEISLKKGCRCIELPIHEQREQIVIKQNRGKSSALLVDALKSIKSIAFTVNPFPIIFSVHCNFPPASGEKVLKIFKSEVGDMLYIHLERERNEHSSLPSPFQLKNKFIIQIVGNNRKTREEENAFTKIATLMPTKLDFERKGLTNWETCQMGLKDICKYEEVEEKNLADYSRIAIVRTCPFQHQSHQTNEQVPNFDPFPMFRNGIQLCAHNVMREDKNHYLIHSKFIENGGRNCGYLIKPKWMKSNCKEGLYVSSFNRILYTIKLKVYSAQKYVLTDTDSDQFKLQIFMKGSKMDEEKNKVHTSPPKKQGFYADFQFECELSIYCPDLAMIVFCVTEANNTQKILSYRAVPFTVVRQGLHTVELLGPGMEINNNSCLLVELFINEEKVKKNIASLLS